MVNATGHSGRWKGSLLIAWINGGRVSAHCVSHLLSPPSASICLRIQSAPFRGLDTIVHSKLGFPKAIQLWFFCSCCCFLSCLDKTGWFKRRPKKVLVK